MKDKVNKTAEGYIYLDTDDYIIIFGDDWRTHEDIADYNYRVITASEWETISGIKPGEIQQVFGAIGIISIIEKQTNRILIMEDYTVENIITAEIKAMMDDAVKTLDRYIKSLDLGFPEFLSDALLDRYREKRKAIIDNGIPAEMFDEYMITA